MTDEDIAKLLVSESERVEWKESLKQTGEIFHAVCALANDLGDSRAEGCLLLGVQKDGRPAGLGLAGPAIDEELRTLADRLRSTKILPTPCFHVEAREYAGALLFIVAVQPHPVPPVVAVDGVAWVRSGSTTVRAREADLQRLRERRPMQSVSFDLRPCPGASLDDLDTVELSRIHGAAREADADPASFPNLEQFLSARQLGVAMGGRWTPNFAAVLLYGRNPQAFLPGATVELVRYAGLDVDAPPAFRRIATGNVPKQLDSVWALLETMNGLVPVENGPLRVGFTPQYPPEALKEMVHNLIQHRAYEGTHAPSRVEWFDDRVEFSNPGVPFGQASQGEFGEHADYRNPQLTAGLVALGYVQQLGRGVRRARRLLEQAGLGFEVRTDGFTRVVVRRRLPSPKAPSFRAECVALQPPR